MTTIYLKRYYPYLPKGTALEVSGETAATLFIGGRLGDSYTRRKREHGECSLEAGEGYEAHELLEGFLLSGNPLDTRILIGGLRTSGNGLPRASVPSQ